MGFFVPDHVAEAKIKRAAKPASAVVKRQEVTKGAKGCDACPLKANWGTLTSPRMTISGPKDARILVLGGGPSKEADFEGKPFSQSEQRLLDRVIPARERDNVAYGHVTRCATSGMIPFQAMHACSVHLAEGLEKRPIKAIIGLGSEPLAYFWPGQQISRVTSVRIPVKIGEREMWYMPVLDLKLGADKLGERELHSPWGATFKADIKRVFNERKTWGKPIVFSPDPKDVIIANTEQEARQAISRMVGTLGIDFESSHLKPYERGSKLLTAALSDCDTTVAFAVDHPECLNQWALPLIIETMRERQWIAHNASMELVWALNKGHIPATEKILHDFDDSQAIIRALFDRETVGGLDEGTMIATGCNIKELTGVNAKRINDYTLSEILPYNGIDAWGSAAINLMFGDAARRDPNYQRILDSVTSTAVMELQGLPLDLDAANTLNKEWSDKAKDEETKALRTFEVRQFEQERGQSFRISANEDVGHALVKHGRLHLPKLAKEGTYKTDDTALTAATKDNPHPLVAAVLAHRTAAKNKATYIDPILEADNRYEDGLLHPSYTVMLTKTARLSSNDPNIQNFPKRKNRELRRSVVPPKDHILLAVDYAQLEWRIAAMAAKDRYLCSTIIKGEDAHAYWRDYILEQYPDYWFRMAEMTNADPNDKKATLKGGRTIIKTDFTFASVFGSSVKSCSERTQIPIDIMTDIQGEFWNRAREVKQWHKARRREYDEFGLVRTLTGRTRRGVMIGNEPINTPIQGTAADVVTESMNAMHRIAQEYKEPCLMPRINIHDDITFFLPDTHESELQEYMYIIGETLTEIRHPWQIVPFAVEFSTGKNWADINEVYVHKGEYLR